jgi:hypothetical protein
MKELDLLKKVEKVDTPPYLMTRIQARIHQEEAEKLPIAWKWAGSLTFVVMILGNIYFSNMGSIGSKPTAESLESNLYLQTQNQLYDE